MHDGILVHQKDFVERLDLIPISSKRSSQKSHSLNEDEIASFRTAIGQGSWTGNQTCPDICFDVLELSMSCKDPTVVQLFQANKMTKKLKSEEYVMKFPGLGNLEDLRLLVYTNSSHANLPDGAPSAGGYVIFLVGKNDSCCILSWSSHKI